MKNKPAQVNGTIRARRTTATLDAAEIEFSQKGFEGTSVQSIADRAGLSKRQVLYFFKTKENLYRDVMNRIFSEWRSFDLHMDDGDPRQIVSKYIEHLFRFSRVKPHRSNLIINEMMRGAPVALPLLHDRRADEAMERTKRRFNKWIGQKKVVPIDPLQFVFLLWSSHHFYAAFESEVAYFMGRDHLTDDDWEHIVEQVKAVFLLIFDKPGRYSTT